MDILKFNKKLRKINVLTTSADESGELSALERDLLLSYIRDLYEIALESKGNKSENEVMEVSHKPTPSASKPASVQIESQHLFEKILPVHPEPVFKQELPQQTVLPREVYVQQEVSVMEEKPKVNMNAKPARQEALGELFTEDKVSDLSDKLGLTPIKDLSRCMGINEKIFTVQELFSSNQAHFNEVMDTLNRFTNFDDAKSYLLDNVIPKYDWTAESKLKKAGTFIKLVKRRYI